MALTLAGTQREVPSATASPSRRARIIEAQLGRRAAPLSSAIPPGRSCATYS